MCRVTVFDLAIFKYCLSYRHLHATEPNISGDKLMKMRMIQAMQNLINLVTDPPFQFISAMVN